MHAQVGGCLQSASWACVACMACVAHTSAQVTEFVLDPMSTDREVFSNTVTKERYFRQIKLSSGTLEGL